MLPYTQTLALLTTEFPERKGNDPVAPTHLSQLHPRLRAFGKRTQELIDLGDFPLVKICFTLAEKC